MPTRVHGCCGFDCHIFGIFQLKFKNKVLPGDTLFFKCDLISPIRRGICHMQGYAYANGKLVSEAELMAQIVKVK